MPADSAPDDLVEAAASVLAEQNGGRVTVTDDPREAVAGADAVYACAWTAA